MSHNNLLSLYCYIDSRKKHLEKQLAGLEAAARQKHHTGGQLDILSEFEGFLHSHFDHKLPRRIYRRLKSNPDFCTSAPDQSYAIAARTK